jgi:hypothetical protein
MILRKFKNELMFDALFDFLVGKWRYALAGFVVVSAIGNFFL